MHGHGKITTLAGTNDVGRFCHANAFWCAILPGVTKDTQFNLPTLNYLSKIVFEVQMSRNFVCALYKV
jgi:hypothetical protein